MTSKKIIPTNINLNILLKKKNKQSYYYYEFNSIDNSRLFVQFVFQNISYRKLHQILSYYKIIINDINTTLSFPFN